MSKSTKTALMRSGDYSDDRLFMMKHYNKCPKILYLAPIHLFINVVTKMSCFTRYCEDTNEERWADVLLFCAKSLSGVWSPKIITVNSRGLRMLAGR